MERAKHIPADDSIENKRCRFVEFASGMVFVARVASCLFLLLFTLSLCAQTPDANTSSTTTTESANSDILNPVRTSTTHSQDGNRTVDTQSLQRVGSDGNFVDYQDVEKETVQVNSSTVRTTTRTFVRDTDGEKTLLQVTEEEKQTSPDGNSKLVRTTSDAGPNGGLQLVQRDVQETKKTGPDTLQTKTTTYLPGVSGLAPAMQVDELQNRTGAHTVEVQKTTLLPDGTGHWGVGEVEKTTVNEEGKGVSSERQVSRPDSNGQLSEVSRTVRKESETAPGQKRETQDTYSIDTPGIAPDGNLHLVQRVTTSQQTSANGAQVTSKQVEQPNPGDPSAGLEVTTGTTNTVVPGPSGAQSTVTVSVRDSSGSLQPVSIAATHSNNIGSVQVPIGPPEKPSTPNTKTSSGKNSSSKEH